MTTQKITTEMLYDLLKQQQNDIHGLKDDIHDLKDDVRDVKTDVRRVDDKLANVDQRLRRVENSIDGIRMTWSSRLVAGILGTSAVTSAAVAYFIASIV